ncbi:MAG: hypothetical protein PHE84_00305 [bacterium]|nr:hypothetical protein [bacterium]
MTIEERLEKVEKELTLLKKTLATAPKVIRANKFIVEDENGKVRAGMVLDEDGPRLGLFDEHGKVRVGMGLDKNGPGLGLLDANGKVIWKAP